jgi:hypothetical protein
MMESKVSLQMSCQPEKEQAKNTERKAVWTMPARAILYQYWKDEMGKYDRETWRGVNPFAPKGVSVREAMMVAENVYHKMLNDKVFDIYGYGRKPTSSRALLQQIVWMTSIQSVENPEVEEMRLANRAAALAVGFISLEDWDYLKAKEIERARRCRAVLRAISDLKKLKSSDLEMKEEIELPQIELKVSEDD